MTAQGPFIVTHRRTASVPREGIDDAFVLSVKAVADLTECVEVVADLVLATSDGVPGCPDAQTILTACESGGTVSLPDGSEIHVEVTSLERLLLEVDGDGGVLLGHERKNPAVVCAMWTARFGVSQEKERSGDGDRA